VIHSYRHRFGLVDGAPEYSATEAALAKLPAITVPTFALDAGATGFSREGTRSHRKHFTGDYQYREIEGAGHNVPQEEPDELAGIILDLNKSVSSAI
jgi:pimeloyl-ACP methyl ester carboxylesterase